MSVEDEEEFLGFCLLLLLLALRPSDGLCALSLWKQEEGCQAIHLALAGTRFDLPL